MERLSRFLNSLPLRKRFLIGPLIGLAVLGLLTSAFILESQRQSALLTRVAQQDLAAFDRYFEIFANVSAQHMALYGLLSGVKSLEEETLYDRAKERLDAIRGAIEELERASETLAAAGPQAPIPAAVHAELLSQTQDYRWAAAAAVELATVKKEVAAAGLDRANERFVAMNRAFAGVLDAQRGRIIEEIEAQVRRSRVNGIVLAAVGAVVAAILLALLVTLSRYLARSLEAQVEVLGELGNQAGGRLVVEGGHEVEKMGHAVDAFRDVLAQLRESERALGAANEALERRVRERTRELAETNAALKDSEEQLKRLAFYDALTGLANRALFNDRLHMAIAQAQRQRKAIAVLFVDLDRFKDVNDTLGHVAGDHLLVEVARRIEDCARDSDTIGRMGGDEFTVLLTQLDSEADAARVAERIIEAVSNPVVLDGQPVLVGASIGISFFPHDGGDAMTLQKHADMAMYAAKQAGRGQYRVFGREMLIRDGESVSLSVEINQALNNDEFSLVYQPIVDVANGRTDTVEALIRWGRPDGEWLLPRQFLPPAEQAGLIKRVDLWVIERACRDAAAWQRDLGRTLRVCVNLSPLTIQQRDTANHIRDILQRTGLPARLLSIEIAETSVIVAQAAALAALNAIVELGVNISIDGFGTGYSSLSHLTQFPVDSIKLDGSFVNRIRKDRAAEEVIRGLLVLARKLDLYVVAEGVEHESQRAFMESVGCELVQGFLVGEPMSAQRLHAWLDDADRQVR